MIFVPNIECLRKYIFIKYPEILLASLIKLSNKEKDIEQELKLFKKELSKVGEEKPLIVFVDELDRCRPSYTIELLESIKHTFDVKNVIFILAINSDSLCKIIQNFYGDIDAEMYLKKFFSYKLKLADPTYEDYAKFIFKKSSLYSRFYYELFEKSFSDLSNFFNFSLRSQNDCLQEIESIFVLNEDEKEYLVFISPLLILFVFLKYKHNEIYEKIKVGKGDRPAVGGIEGRINKLDSTRFISDLFADNYKFRYLFNNQDLDFTPLIKKQELIEDYKWTKELLEECKEEQREISLNKNSQTKNILKLYNGSKSLNNINDKCYEKEKLIENINMISGFMGILDNIKNFTNLNNYIISKIEMID